MTLISDMWWSRKYRKEGRFTSITGVKGFQNVFVLRSIWRSVVGEGNVDVNYIKSKKGYRWSKARLAMYLAKYIGKDMESELNKKRFRSSQGITITGHTSKKVAEQYEQKKKKRNSRTEDVPREVL